VAPITSAAAVAEVRHTGGSKDAALGEAASEAKAEAEQSSSPDGVGVSTVVRALATAPDAAAAVHAAAEAAVLAEHAVADISFSAADRPQDAPGIVNAAYRVESYPAGEDIKMEEPPP
jgi:hypothetical protein